LAFRNHAGYAGSQHKRKRIEEVFGWLRTVGMLRKTRHRRVFKVGWVFILAAEAYARVMRVSDGRRSGRLKQH